MSRIDEAGDFRMLLAIRAAMRPAYPVIAIPIECPVIIAKRKRRGMRRIMRETARPFEQLARVLRRVCRA